MGDTDSLRDEMLAIARDSDLGLLDRSVAVMGALSEALRLLNVEPVLVGGMAVLFWTSDEAFATSDIDLVMDEPPEAEQLLRDLGFELATDGRHWELSGGSVLLELPSRHLPEGAEVEVFELAGGRTVSVLSKVDVAIVRLEELTLGPHEDITLQALALLSGIDADEMDRLHERAKQAGVTGLLDRLLPVANDVAAGATTLPDPEALYRLVKGS